MRCILLRKMSQSLKHESDLSVCSSACAFVFFVVFVLVLVVAVAVVVCSFQLRLEHASAVAKLQEEHKNKIAQLAAVSFLPPCS